MLAKKDKGVVISYLRKVTGYSRSQTTRLIKKYIKDGKIIFKHLATKGFEKKYTNADIRILAKLDAWHDKPCGQTVKKLCERAFQVFHEKEFEILSGISTSHLYYLRAKPIYQRLNMHFEKTKSKPSSIGERRKPQADGKPGHIRIDTVHQGDLGKKKGVYHINVIDEVTQFEVVYSVEKITEQYMIPALEYILSFFLFKISGFHSDNGSEYINQFLVKILNKLNNEFTKSRPRHSKDNVG